MNKIYLALLSILFIAGTAEAQLVSTTNGNGNQLAQTLAGTGVTITNVTMNCPTGAAGTFNCVNCNLGMASGIVLTTGQDSMIHGPNNNPAISYDNGGGSDQDLSDIINANLPWWQAPYDLYNACALEFDMQVLSDSVQFNYIFGSDEYPEYVCSEFNDIFAFFISGPGIAGSENIALIPGTTTAVAINSVNSGQVGSAGTAGGCTSLAYSSYFVNNGDGLTTQPNLSNPTYIQYNGFTTPLTAKKKGLQACQTYHLKLAIADVYDGIFDSGVFLEANSLTSNAVQVDDATTTDPGVTNAVETCVDGTVRFTIETPVPYPTVVRYGISGSATNGVDYTWIADSIIIPANDTQVVLNIHPLSDGQFEFIESVVISLFNACNATPYDSSVLLIIDSSSVYAGPDTTVCAGTPLQLNATDGVVYTWSPAAGLSDPTIPNPTVTPTQSITYRVTSVAGACATTDSMRINVVPPPFTVNAGTDVALCPGQSAQLNAIVTGNPLPGSPFQYAWTPTADLTSTNTLATTATPSGPVTYVISVQSGQCTQVDSINIIPGQLAITGASTNETCFGYSNGSASVTVTTGQTPYTFTWSNSGAGNVPSQNTLTAGTYYVTVSDAGNCTATDTFNITSPPAIYFSAPTVTNASCFTSTDGSISITASGGAGNITYAWSNGGGNTGTISNLGPNTYTVTATDANGCTNDTSIVVTSQPQIIINLVPTQIVCFGDNNGAVNATVSGGAGGFTYLWSNTAVTEDISGLAPANYILTVTDANNCTQSANVTITQPTQLTLGTPTIVNVLCYGGNNGSIISSPAGGTTPYSYNWGGTVGSGIGVSNLIAGTYMVTVTDAATCTTSATYSVTQPAAPLEISSDVVTDATCFGASDGSVVITVIGGTPSYSYTWSNGTTVTGPANNGIPAGLYSVTVRDANQCTVTAAYTVGQPTEIIFTQVANTNVNCNGGADGTATVTATGGGGTFTYAWSNSFNGNAPTGLAANTYYVTATDGAGCTADTFVVITEPALLTAAATATNVSCNAGSNGSTTVVAGGGTPPYTYAWSNGRTTANVTGLTADNYYVTVTDANLCTTQAGTVVTEPTGLSVTYTAEAPKCVYTIDGTITATASGGTPTYSYTLQLNGTDLETNTTGAFVGLAANTYNVLATDANSCPANVTSIVPPPTPDVFDYVVDTTSCFGSNYNDGSITIVPISFVNAPYTYSVDNGATQFSEVFFNLSAGEHTVTISSNNGCITDTTLLVPEPIEGFVEALPTDTTIMAGESIQLASTFINYPATSVTAYVWSPGTGLTCMDCANPTFNGYATTTYTLTAVYHNGCIATTTVDIIVDGNPPIYVPNAFTPNGDGNNDVFMLYSQQVASMKMKVFNRWGEKVFESNNQFFGWDGLYQSVLQPMGVYTYIVEVTYLDGETATQNGSVTLIR